MKNSLLLSIALMFVFTISKAQTATPFAGMDCNNNPVDLFADLDAGKAVVLEFYMPNCGSCPPPAQRIQAMGNKINQTYPGMVKGYAFPYQNSTTCTYSASWVNSNNLSSFWTPMDSGAYQVAYYGGFGMPTVVLLGGQDHRVMFSTLSFSTSDTTIMRDSILALFTSTGTMELQNSIKSFTVFPNPANANFTINLDLEKTSEIFVELSDLSGKRMAVIMNEKRGGIVTKEFQSNAIPSGNYLIRLIVDGKVSTQNLTISH